MLAYIEGYFTYKCEQSTSQDKFKSGINHKKTIYSIVAQGQQVPSVGRRTRKIGTM